MGKPVEGSTVDSVMMEIICAISALKMAPKSLDPQVDKWVVHSFIHMTQAYDNINNLKIKEVLK